GSEKTLSGQSGFGEDDNAARKCFDRAGIERWRSAGKDYCGLARRFGQVRNHAPQVFLVQVNGVSLFGRDRRVKARCSVATPGCAFSMRLASGKCLVRRARTLAKARANRIGVLAIP